MRFRRSQPAAQTLALLTALLAFSTTVHPWYALWTLPSAALLRAAPWLLFTATSSLAYAVYFQAEATGIWREIIWLRWAIYLPPLMLALWQWKSKKLPSSG
jgi:hypothetical protein